MIKLQDPVILAPISAIEIDKAIYETQILLETNLDWITHGYARAYRHLDVDGKKMYFPEVYQGGVKNSYHRVTPDNDKKGMFFFVVSEEKNESFQYGQNNLLKWNVGIVFWVNTKLINKDLGENEVFTQNLIRDVRDVLTRKARGLSFSYKVNTVQREFNQVYKEFSINEGEKYLKMPYQAFRFNLDVVMSEDCDISYNRASAILKNLSAPEKLEVLKSIDFSVSANVDAFTSEQKTQLGI